MADQKTKKAKKTKEKAKLDYSTIFRMYRVYGYLYKVHWKPLMAAFGGQIFTILIALLLPWPLKLIIDYVILQAPLPPEATFVYGWFGTEVMALLGGLVIAYIVLYLMDSFASYFHRVGLLTAGEKMATDIRDRLFAHLQQLSLSFHNSSRSGDLIYRLTFDINHVKMVLVELPNFVTYRLLTIIAHMVLMCLLEWRLALLAFTVVPVLYLYNRKFGKSVDKAVKKKRKKESDISQIVTENVTAMALIQAYGREDSQQARFALENRESLESGISAMRLTKLFKRLNQILMALGTGAVAYYGGLLALEGSILPGTLVLFVAYLRNLYKPIKKFAEMLLKVVTAQVSCARLLEVADSESTVVEMPDAAPLKPLKGKVAFDNVTFSYQDEFTVLKDVSFTVEAGETVALVGHSGAGKSTLIALLMRFYDPEKGAILMDGQEIRQATIKSLRNQLTIVMQEAQLFQKSIFENITFGKEGASEAEVIAAAKAAQAHQFISDIPDGYHAVLAEGGDNLSGGQKQRINIARAMIRNTPILILDEPATALDAKSEKLVQQAMEELTRNKTTFIIAHKFSTIANVDKILVLDKGQLVGFGKHEELLESCLPYQEFYHAQFAPIENGQSKKLSTAETG